MSALGADRPLMLASRSPRRRALLEAAGVACEVCAADIEEENHHGETPRATVLKTALAKAIEVAPGLEPGRIVLAADTMVVIEGETLGKPADAEAARAMLGRLSGRRHSVFTGMALMRCDGETLVDAVEAGVVFRDLTPAEIEAYVATGDCFDKAGSYGIQGASGTFVQAVEGDLTCVVGLPMRRLSELFAEMTGASLFDGMSLRAAARCAFPELDRLPPACLVGIPD